MRKISESKALIITIFIAIMAVSAALIAGKSAKSVIIPALASFSLSCFSFINNRSGFSFNNYIMTGEVSIYIISSLTGFFFGLTTARFFVPLFLGIILGSFFLKKYSRHASNSLFPGLTLVISSWAAFFMVGFLISGKLELIPFSIKPNIEISNNLISMHALITIFAITVLFLLRNKLSFFFKKSGLTSFIVIFIRATELILCLSVAGLSAVQVDFIYLKSKTHLIFTFLLTFTTTMVVIAIMDSNLTVGLAISFVLNYISGHLKKTKQKSIYDKAREHFIFN